jgi:pimeloyl-ACP methyl ester carboxylesterase
VLAIVNGIPVHYAQHGGGTPVLALHGSGVDHREIMGALEPVFADRPGYRRVYPDLPGMGRSPAPETIDSTDAVLDTLLGLVDAVIGAEAFLVVGHSYGGYLARAIANRRPRQVAGLALLCSLLGEQVGEDKRPDGGSCARRPSRHPHTPTRR